jgi:hypothetical protein
MRWRRTLRQDDGTTLIEAMLAVVIAGIAVSALLFGMVVFVVESDRTDEHAIANRVLLEVTEALRGPTVAYDVTCEPTPYEVSDAGLASWGVSLPAGWGSSSVQIESIRYWDGGAFGADCDDDDEETEPPRLQEITVRVSDPDGRASASLAVVKRDR